jgi:AraC-like DNA-binding protein
MPVLPIPMIIALLLFGFLIQRLVARETHATILALIALCAFQAAIIALVQHYGFSTLRPLQAISATVIPPVAWAAFSTAAGGDIRPQKMLLHVVGPLSAIACFLFNPFWLDALIPISFAAYGIAILRHLWRGEDSILHSRLEVGSRALLAWRIIGLSLVASALCDVAIALGLAFGVKDIIMWFPSVVSLLSLSSLGILSLSQGVESRREHETDDRSEEDAARDQTIIAKLDRYLEEQQPYLDPDLTLARLSRKLVIPAKQLSTAINRSKSENVSRHINRHRIEHACHLIAAGKSVTTAMFDSGFNTKSNFNREFLRLKGVPPSAWQVSQTASLNSGQSALNSVIQDITKRDS